MRSAALSDKFTLVLKVKMLFDTRHSCLLGHNYRIKGRSANFRFLHARANSEHARISMESSRAI